MSKSLFARTRYVRTARLRRNRWREHLTDYLIKAETEAPGRDEQDHYAFCRRLVNLAFDDWPGDPYVAAFYYHYGKHPKKLIPEWLSRDAKDKRMEIPDYDPLSDPLGKVRIPSSGLAIWPDQEDTAEDFAQPNPFLQAQRKYHQEYRQRQIALRICTECRNPCEESSTLCAFHRQRAREASSRSYVRKRLAMGKTVQHGKHWHERHEREAFESVMSGGFCGS